MSDQSLKAKLVTFEGTEGSGKTTQIRLLADYFEKKGASVLATREPGGTALGNELRALVLQKRSESLDPMAELLIIQAARAQHVSQILRPAMQVHDLILCDRYADASLAYQGAGRNLGFSWVEDLNQKTTGGLLPDRTFLLDLSEEVSVKRALGRIAKSKNPAEAEDRFEMEALSFHRTVRNAYLDIAKKNPQRFRVIDASDSPESINKVIRKEIEEVLKT